MKTAQKTKKRIRRHKRVRAKVFGTASCPRLAVFRSNKHIKLQLIDDQKGRTLLQVDDPRKMKKKARLDARQATKTEIAFETGKLFAEQAKAKKIKKVVFDRGGYNFGGRVQAVADGARKGGLVF